MKAFLKSKAGRITLIASAAVLVAAAAILTFLLLQPEAYRTIVAVQVEGTAIVSNSKSDSIQVYDNMNLYSGDRMAVSENSWVTLELDGDKHVLAEENAKLWLEATGSAGSERTVIHLEEGSALIRIENKLTDEQSYEVHTPNSVISVRGTVFRISVDQPERSNSIVRVEAFDGEVAVTPINDELIETDGTEMFIIDQCGLVEGNGELSRFVRDTENSAYSAINYQNLPDRVVQELIDYADDGEALSKDKDYLYSLIPDVKQTAEAPETAGASVVPDSPDTPEEPDTPDAHRHDYSSEWTWDDKGHWHAAACEHAEEISEYAIHSGGTASCQHKAICEICGTEYGTLTDHRYGDSWQSDIGSHWKKCVFCGSVTIPEQHTGGAYSVCDVCGTEYGNPDQHQFSAEWSSDEGSHWRECSHCDISSDTAAHTGGTATCTERAKCQVCGRAYGVTAEHSYSSVWSSDNSRHWHKCTLCGDISAAAAHTGGKATCTARAKCSVCGTEYGEYSAHSFESTWISDAGSHWHKCAYCNEISGIAAHTGENGKCSVCGANYDTQTKHDYDSTWYSNAESHWHKCRDCGAISDTAAHSGGKATCTARAKCSVCGAEYGSLAQHSYSTAWSTDSSSHWHECSICGEAADTAAHSGGKATCTEKAKCSTCGKEYGSLAEHSYGTAWYSDGSSHWRQCSSCGEKSDSSSHSGGTATCTAKAKCSACGKEYGSLAEHSYGTAWYSDGSSHWRQCSGCGEKSDSSSHSGGTATCTAKAKCSTCGKEYGDYADHDYDKNWVSDMGNHWQQCKNCTAITLKGTHSGGTATCTTQAKCSTCGKEYGELGQHDYSGSWQSDSTNHWHVCSNCTSTADNAAHSGGIATCTEQAKCSTCGTAYGEKGSTHNYSDSYSYDSTTHYYACLNPGCDSKTNISGHTGGTANCTNLAQCQICGSQYGEYGGHVETVTNFDDTYHYFHCNICDKDTHSGTHDMKFAESIEIDGEYYNVYVCTMCSYRSYEKIDTSINGDVQ